MIVAPTRWGGVAAVRSLGRHGVDVWAATTTRDELALHSRFVRRVLRLPPATDPARLVRALLRANLRGQRPVLVPTDDLTAWAYALHAEALAERFAVYAPAPGTLVQIIDKVRLAEVCDAASVPAPRAAAVTPSEATAPLPFPFFLKTRTRLGTARPKGAVVRSDADFARALAALDDDEHAPSAEAAGPGASGLIAQELLARRGQGVYSISGFIMREGEVLGMRASNKVLDRPPRTGGYSVLLEDAAVEPEARASIVRLCRTTGFFGAFDVEFIRRDGVPLLIDFNPRPTGTVAFDIARGLDLPRMQYAAALGDARQLRALAEVASATAGPSSLGYCDRPKLEAGLRQWGDDGLMTRKAARRWLRAHRGRLVQPAHDLRDPLPGIAAYWSAAVGLGRSIAHR